MAEMERLARAAAARLRLRMDRPVARGEAVRRAGAAADRLLAAGGVPVRWRRCTRAGRSRSRCCWWCRSACSARCWASTLRGMPNDVYFKVGLITIIGLSAKNAILIIEFAKDLHAQGKGLVEATLEACHLRFRPILMTSLAFILGVMPLALATGAGSASQRAIGTGVMGGMISRHRAGGVLRAGVLRRASAASSRAANASARCIRTPRRRGAVGQRCRQGMNAGDARAPAVRRSRPLLSGCMSLAPNYDARRCRWPNVPPPPAPNADASAPSVADIAGATSSPIARLRRADRAGAGEQPRSAHRGAQYRAGAGTRADPAAPSLLPTVGAGFSGSRQPLPSGGAPGGLQRRAW